MRLPIPVVPRQIGSFVQVLEQPLPSPLKRPFGTEQPAGNFVGSVPQSQPSLPSFIPLPQTLTEHFPGAGAPPRSSGSSRPLDLAGR